MNFKRYISLILALTLCIGLFSCAPLMQGDRETEPSEKTEPSPLPETTLPESTDRVTAPESTLPEMPPVTPEIPPFSEKLTLFLEAVRLELDALGDGLTPPTDESVESVAAEIRGALSELAEFELTDEKITEYTRDFTNALADELYSLGLRPETVSSFCDGLALYVDELYRSDLDTDLAERLIADVRSLLIDAYAEINGDGAAAEAFAEAQLTALLALFDPTDSKKATEKLSELLATVKSELDRSGLSRDEFVSYIEETKSLVLDIMNGSLSDERALELGRSLESATYSLLAAAGVTREDAEAFVAEAKATASAILGATLSEEELKDAFASLHGAIDSFEATVGEFMGECDDGNHELISLITAMLTAAGGAEVENKAEIAMIAVKIKSMLQDTADFKITNAMRVDFVDSVAKELRFTLLANGITVETVNAFFAELEELIPEIYSVEIDSRLVEDIIDGIESELEKAYLSKGGKATEARQFAKAQTAAILAAVDPTDAASAKEKIADALSSLRDEMEMSGLSSRAILNYAGAIKRILIKILTDTITDLEAIAAARAVESMVMKALESAGITEEMLESTVQKLRDAINTVTEAELTDENIDDLFSTLHTAADTLEESVMTAIGESDGGEYSLVYVISALTAAAGSSQK